MNFFYPDKIVTEYEGSVEVLAISRAWPIRRSVHKAKISSPSLEFYSKVLAPGY